MKANIYFENTIALWPVYCEQKLKFNNLEKIHDIED
jgi:hypothetical protein